MLKHLNQQQIDAVIEENNVLLTACPGSGKTRSLTHKIVYELNLLKDQKKLIIAVTFTNRAADEIKKRIRDFNTDDSNLWAGTIHSFCLEWILRPYMCYEDELKNGFSIADEYKQEILINNLKEKYELKFWTLVSTRYLTNGEKEEVENRALVDEYHEILSSQKLIDFDQILHYAYKILSTFPKISEILKSMFHLVCVDEYQDTQELQYAILAEIIKAKFGSCKIFMVGDKDQAIYGSLGGVAKTRQEIEIQFGNIEIKSKELSGNYRSNQEIIDYSCAFKSSTLDIKSLGKNASNSALITYSQTVHKDELPSFIAQLITNTLVNGIPENEICVLAPQWQLVIPIGRKLKVLLPNVNFDAVGLSPLLKNKENIWFKVARLFLVEPSPRMLLIRKRWAKELISEFEDLDISCFELDEFKAKKLLRVINSIKSDKNDGLEYLEECFQKLMSELQFKKDENNYISQHWDAFFESSKKRLKILDFDYAKDIESFKRMFSHNVGIVVNTCHGVKGEEFDTVIAFGLLHGKLPNWNDQNPSDSAKKLLYVICSRAKNKIHLISELGRQTASGRAYQPTEQLNEISFEYGEVTLE